MILRFWGNDLKDDEENMEDPTMSNFCCDITKFEKIDFNTKEINCGRNWINCGLLFPGDTGTIAVSLPP